MMKLKLVMQDCGMAARPALVDESGEVVAMGRNTHYERVGIDPASDVIPFSKAPERFEKLPYADKRIEALQKLAVCWNAAQEGGAAK